MKTARTIFLAMLLAFARVASAQEAPAMESTDSREWLSYGRALSAANRHREAIPAFQRAIQLRSRDAAQCALSVARSYALLGNSKQASRWVETAILFGYKPEAIATDEPLLKSFHAIPTSVPTPASRVPILHSAFQN